VNRWPVDPLLDLPGVTEYVLCGALRTSGGPWHRMKAEGLTDWQADRAAVRLGHMPHVVWPDWIDAGLTELDRDYLAGGWRQAWEWNEAQAAGRALEAEVAA